MPVNHAVQASTNPVPAVRAAGTAPGSPGTGGNRRAAQ